MTPKQSAVKTGGMAPAELQAALEKLDLSPNALAQMIGMPYDKSIRRALEKNGDGATPLVGFIVRVLLREHMPKKGANWSDQDTLHRAVEECVRAIFDDAIRQGWSVSEIANKVSKSEQWLAQSLGERSAE
ncbi:MAG: hypothetical protein ABW199_07490 [Caulobacterales bacterium]